MSPPPEPLIVCVDGQFIHWLRTPAEPGSPPVTAEAMAAYLTHQGLTADRAQQLINEARLRGTSNPAEPLEVVLTDAARNRAGIDAAGLLSWAASPRLPGTP